MFELITPLSYWVLAILWLVILGLYLARLRQLKSADTAIAILLTILAVDAFRTLFESAYFGLYFNAQFGLLPASIETTLGRPELLIIPKLMNVAAGALVLFLLIYRWVPREITVRQEQLKQLKSSEELYRDFVEGADHLVTRVDADGNFTFVNSRAGELFGLPPSECIGLPVIDFVHPDDREMLRATLVASIRDKANYATLEDRHLSQSGVVTHLLWSMSMHYDELGNITHVNSIGRDISRRRLAEERRHLLATAVEQASESILITDDAGTIQYVNPAFEIHTGYNAEEAIGETPRILKSGQHGRAFYVNMWDTLEQGRIWKGHLINKSKDGSLCREETTISPVQDADGKIVNYVAVERDVTWEAELKAELAQAQKMEAIGTLAGGIAHDFNNLLQIMLGYLDLARANTPSDGPTAKYLEQILIAGERASVLVAQILTFSRRSERKRRPQLLQPVIKEVLGLLRSSIPSTIEIRRSIDEDTGPVMADSTELHQIAMNLCTNAYHAMRESGGVLEVTLGETTLDREAASRVHGLGEGRVVRLAVRDTGTGMDATTLERIFDPYFTTKPIGEGTGLGLATVRGLVEGSGGALTVESEPGGGTLFEVYLPLVPRAAIGGSAETLVSDVHTGAERLLVVDDEPMVVEQARLGLESSGYRVEACTSSPEALEIFRASPDGFDLVITDQTMPGMTGLELSKELMLIRPGIPIILCTGFSELVDETSAEAAGIRKYLRKPILPRVLAEAVRKIMKEEESGCE